MKISLKWYRLYWGAEGTFSN